MNNLTVVYYTSNHLEETNPYFLTNTKKQLLKAIGELPLVVVGHKPSYFPSPGKPFKEVLMGDIGRSHLNIYRQILEGCKVAKTKYVAMAEDDILYSESHFNSKQLEKDLNNNPETFIYDMNKVSLFTWTKPPIFSFRSKRMVVNQLLCERDYLIDALEERFERVEQHVKDGGKEEDLLKFFGDPGRYERQLGVKVRKTFQTYSQTPSIVFSHPQAYGFLSQGTRKRHGDIKIIELADWGTASSVLKLWGKNEKK